MEELAERLVAIDFVADFLNKHGKQLKLVVANEQEIQDIELSKEFLKNVSSFVPEYYDEKQFISLIDETLNLVKNYDDLQEIEVRLKTLKNSINEDLLNETRWITVHPNKENEEDYRRLPVEDGETVKEAIDKHFDKEEPKNKEKTVSKEQKKEKTEEPKKEKSEKQESLSQKFVKKYKEMQEEYDKYSKENYNISQKMKEEHEKLKKEKGYYKLDEQRSEAIKNQEYAKYRELSEEITKLYNNLWNEVKGMKEFSDFDERTKKSSEMLMKQLDFKKESISNYSEQIGEAIKNYSKKTEKVFNQINKDKDFIKIQSLKYDAKKYREQILKLGYFSPERQEAVKKFASTKIEIEKLEEDVIKKVSDMLKKGKAFNSKVDVGSCVKGLDEVKNKLLNALNGTFSDNYNNDGLKINGTKAKRAYQFAGAVYLNSNETRTAIHEYMHFLEARNPEMLFNSLAFLEKRTKGEKAESLKKITGNSAYKGEYAKKDGFFDPYCGKIYATDGLNTTALSTASEIMSMGVEKLFTNPKEFAKLDREYFDFVIANLRGEL